MGEVQREALGARNGSFRRLATHCRSASLWSVDRRVKEKRVVKSVSRKKFVPIGYIPVVARVELVVVELLFSATDVVHVGSLIYVGVRQEVKNICGNRADPIRAYNVQNSVA